MGKIKEKKLSGIWEVVHRVLATDHYTYGSTLVEAKTPKEAFKIFNESVADGNYKLRSEKVGNVYPVKVYGK
jgi:hypothetical protein